MKTFEEFWPYYLSAHKRPLTRKLHFWGLNLYFISWLPFMLTLKRELLWAPIFCLLIGYLMGAVTHFKIEKNHPNAKHPLWGVKALWMMYGMMWLNIMDKEMIRVFGTSRPEKDALFLIDPTLEYDYIKKQKVKISDEWTDHPFTEYFDIFLLKHQHPINVFVHVLTMVWYSLGIILAISLQQLWPLLFAIPSMYFGNWAHKKFENNFVDPTDALASPRAMKSLWKMLWLYLTGQYWNEVQKRQKILFDFRASHNQENKQNHSSPR